MLDFRRGAEIAPSETQINPKSGGITKDNSPKSWVFTANNQLEKHSNAKAKKGGLEIVSGLQEEGYLCPGDDFNKIQWYHEYWKLALDHYSNPLSSLVSSKTMLLPHQVQAAIQVVESLQPRFLIADEVGLGKTIETGLILKELILKYGYDKILVVVPAPLTFQWQSELSEKFNEKFRIIDGNVLRKEPDILQTESKVIASVDLLKIPVYWDRFLEKNFDVVIFDEAHRLRKDSFKTTKAFQFAEKVSLSCKALLLLSATPFRGKLEEIYYLVSIIDPDILGPFHTFYQEYTESGGESLKDKLAPVVIRRRKKDVGGFTSRFARTVRFNLDSLERSFYDAVTEYVKKEYNRALASSQNVKAFVMVIFQKLLDSSSYALIQALLKRKERLEKLYYRISQSAENPELAIFEQDDMENIVDDFWETEENNLDLTFNPEEVRQEIFSLNRLLFLGKKIGTDMKLNVLLRTIKSLKKEGHKKIIIFTQFVNTMKYMKEHLSESYKVTLFYGGLSAQEKENAIAEFFNRTEILICTEAGGEGRNLQVATVLINYDLPWSPLKIEQRIGRIHRFGQKSDVYIINFATRDTIAEKVLEILEKKIKLFEDAFGQSDVLLGTAEDDKSFEKNIQSLLKEKKTFREVEDEIEKSVKLAKKNVTKIDSLLTTEVLDFNMSAFSRALRKRELVSERESTLKNIITRYQNNDQINGPNKSQIKNQVSGALIHQKNNIFTYRSGSAIKQGSFDQGVCEKNPAIEYLTLGHDVVDQELSELSKAVEQYPLYCVQSGHSNKAGLLGFFQAHIHLDRVYKRFYTVYYQADKKKVYFDKQVIKNEFKFLNQHIAFEDIKEPLVAILSELNEKITEDTEKIQRKIHYGVNYWKKNLESSHISREKELLEKLEIQKGKAKWYGQDKMVGAISRTVNQQKDEQKRWKQKISGLEKNMDVKIELKIRHMILFKK